MPILFIKKTVIIGKYSRVTVNYFSDNNWKTTTLLTADKVIHQGN